MSLKNQLILIISIILASLCLLILDVLNFDQIFEYGGEAIYIVTTLFDIVIILFLFSFVAQHNKQKLYLLPFLLIVLLSVFHLIEHFHPLIEEPSPDQTLKENALNLFLIQGIPTLIELFSLCVIAYQLLKNNINNEKKRHNIMLVGKSYFVRIAGLFTIPILPLLIEEFIWIEEASALVYSIPFILMLKMYWEEFHGVKVDNMA